MRRSHTKKDDSDSDECDVKHGGEQEENENAIPQQVKVDSRLHGTLESRSISSKSANFSQDSCDSSQQCHAHLFLFWGGRWLADGRTAI